MDTLSAKDSYQHFIEATEKHGYNFAELLDERRRTYGCQWIDPAAKCSNRPRISATFDFIRRQSWLQISLTFFVSSVPVKINGEPSLIDISRSAANLLGDFIEDHPKSGTGVEAAAVEVTKLLDRFRAEFEILENQSTWSRDMMLMGAPLSQWPIVPGLKVWPAEAE